MQAPRTTQRPVQSALCPAVQAVQLARGLVQGSVQWQAEVTVHWLYVPVQPRRAQAVQRMRPVRRLPPWTLPQPRPVQHHCVQLVRPVQLVRTAVQTRGAVVTVLSHDAGVQRRRSMRPSVRQAELHGFHPVGN